MSDCIMLKKVKEEAVLNSARAEIERTIQEHTCLNTDFLTFFWACWDLIFLVDDQNILPPQQTSKTSSSWHLGNFQVETFGLRPHMARGLSTTTIFVPQGKLSFMNTDTLKSHSMLTPCLFGSCKRGLKFSVRKNENVPSCINFL